MSLQTMTTISKVFNRFKTRQTAPVSAFDSALELAKHCARAPDGDLAARDAASPLVQVIKTLTELERQAFLQQLLSLPRKMFWRRLAGVEGGLHEIVSLRELLLQQLEQHPDLSPLASELADFLADRFDLGCLQHRQLTWHSSAAVLEQLMTYEAVHAFDGWSDLKHRLRGKDRRCYALFHPMLPNLPVAFVEVALANKLATSVEELLNPTAPVCPADNTHYAIFYAISSTLKGLKGIGFGEHLIQLTAAALRREIPTLNETVTLSPIPGFRAWLTQSTADDCQMPAKIIKQLGGRWPDIAFLDQAISDTTHSDTKAVRTFLEFACLQYLQRRRDDGTAEDPVARFHIGNGASIERLNYLGDTSSKGLQQSLGMMVNYRYPNNRAELFANRHAYRQAHNIRLLRP